MFLQKAFISSNILHNGQGFLRLIITQLLLRLEKNKGCKFYLRFFSSDLYLYCRLPLKLPEEFHCVREREKGRAVMNNATMKGKNPLYASTSYKNLAGC